MMITYRDGVKSVDLPKWPAFVVVGERVTSEQATEILVRTDSNRFDWSTNDRYHQAQLDRLFGFPNERSWEQTASLVDAYDCLDLYYLHNHQIASCYIGGPHGWCDWDGNIGCNTYNIGKWPSVEEIAVDWAAIAAAFPYLRLKSQVYSGEYCDEGTEPVAEFNVADGEVAVTAPTQRLEVSGISDEHLLQRFLQPGGERGITATELGKRIEAVFGRVIKVGNV